MQEASVAYGQVVTSNGATVDIRILITFPPSAIVPISIIDNGDGTLSITPSLAGVINIVDNGDGTISLTPIGDWVSIVDDGDGLLTIRFRNVTPDMSLTVASVDVRRQMATDLPAGTRLITGYPSADASFTLSGLVDQSDGSATVAWYMGRYSRSSPIYRQSCLGANVVIQQGVLTDTGMEYVTTFTGEIDDYTEDPTSGTVAVSALDYRSKLFGLPTLPPVVTAPPYNSGLTSEFAVDYLLRHGSNYHFSSWPPIRSSCIMAAGMRSSVWPEVGSLNLVLGANAVADFVPGKFGTAITTPTSAFPVYDTAPPSLPNVELFIEFWASATTGSSFVQVTEQPNEMTIAVHLGYGYVQVLVADGLTSWSDTWTVTVPADASTHYVGALILMTPGAATWSATVYFDAATYTSGTRTVSGTRPALGASRYVSVGAQTGGTIEAVQVTTEGAGAPSNAGFAPWAVLDPSLNPMTAMPDVSSYTDAWSAIQAGAEAEFGIAGLDESGVFRFKNRATLQSGPVVRNVTADSSLATIQIQTAQSITANHVQIPVSIAQIQPFSPVWSASTTYGVGQYGSLTVPVTFTSSAVAVATTCVVIPSGGLSASTSGYRAAVNSDGSGGQVTNLIMWLTDITATTANVRIYNPNGFPVFLVTPTGAGYPSTSEGQPAWEVGGMLVTPSAVAVDGTILVGSQVVADAQYPALTPDGGAAKSSHGDMLVSVQANPWLQSPSVAEALAVALLGDLVSPRPQWVNVVIAADPRLQIGDRVTVSDPDVSGIDGDTAIISGIEQHSDWTTALTLRADASPGKWQLGVSGRSELGVTTWT